MSTSTLPKSIQAQVSANESLNRTNETTSSSQDRAQIYKDFIEKYKQLPDDFLRIPSSYYPSPSDFNIASHHARAMIAREAPLNDMVAISVVEAQLVKNYGLLKMDLYCKIRVGHMSLETETCLNGGKNPKWRELHHFNLQPGINSFHLEIYDQKSFSLDEKIAWLYEPIPPEVFQGITVERWFPLSGRLGQDKEGSVLVVLSFKRVPTMGSFARTIGGGQNRDPTLAVYMPTPHTTNQSQMVGCPIVPGPGAADQHIPAYIQAPPPPQPQTVPTVPLSMNANQQQSLDTTVSTTTRPVSDEDVDQLSEMFPSLDKAIIKAVLENNHNDKEASIGALLALG